jgi:hypothetical protein
MKKRLLTLLPLLGLFLTTLAQQLAFPGAEGFGAYATGGRGGQVVHVTNLNADGAGSLADAVSKPGRFVVFDVGGVIDITGKSITIASNITIAGQTAPGEGITIYGGRVIASKSKNIIMRYIRMRGGKSVNEKKCTLTLDECENLIMDHCTVSWGPWDNVHIKDANNITWQYCINAEGIEPQRFGSITDGTRNWTIHHCLWINNKSRNPKMKCYLQYYNNVVYNYAMGIVGGHSAADNYQDVMNNYFIAGPNGSYKYFDDWTATDHLYSTGNYYDGNCDGQLNGTLITDYNGATPMKQPNFNTTHPMNVQTAAEAYAAVVEHVGASRVRDSHDKRYIEQLTSLGKKGAFIANEDDVNGIGTVANGKKPRDTDGDGMPDEWEQANGLNPQADDACAMTLGGGYTNIEHYANSLAQKIELPDDPASTMVRSLESAIENALALAGNAKTNVTLGYPSEAVEALLATASEAQAYIDDIDPATVTKEEIDAAVTYLNQAMADFKTKVINTFTGFSTDVCYNIFSYGMHPGARDANASTSTERRYLYNVKSADGQRDSLVYRLGLSDASIASGKTDAMASDAAALWTFREAGNGFVYVQNAKTGAYMQIERLLSATPVAIRPYYAKNDNGKTAFYMDASNGSDIRCFNVGELDTTGKGGPLDFSTLHADRIRLRWVIQETGVEASVINRMTTTLSTPVSVRYYNLQGVQLNQQPTHGFYIEHRIAANGRRDVRKSYR